MELIVALGFLGVTLALVSIAAAIDKAPVGYPATIAAVGSAVVIIALYIAVIGAVN